MIVTVKSVKILKTGTSAKGEWKLVGVTGEDDVSYTTFNAGAINLPQGAIIDIGTPASDSQNRLSFKEYKVMALKETTPGELLPEHQAEVDKSVAETHKPMGVEIGKCENQVIQLYIAGKLSSMFGEKVAIELTKIVRGSILATLKPDYDGKDLPQFKAKAE